MKFNPILTDDFSFNYIRTPKKFTLKAFTKFDIIQRQLLCERYDIILTDYETDKEKIIKIIKKFKKFNIKNLNKGITKFNKQMSQFNEMMAPEKPQRTRKSKSKTKIVYRDNPKDTESESLWGSDKDMSKTVKDLLG